WLQYNSSYIYTEIDNASMQVVVISNKNAPSTSLTTSIPPDTSTVTGTSTISATTQSTTVPPKVVAVEDNSIYLYAMIAEAIVIIALIVALVIARKKGSSAQIGQIPQ
ncbi:hypothetical protein M1583_01345, partial [Candidatus Marsarchaeota archaeon]|nr:hypothetical protein [Candidatus Marsarchaeota archaeon]